MKKNNLRIKENITFVDQVNAIEAITDAAFKNGRYTPYYLDIRKIEVIMKNFITGYELEEDEDLYHAAMNDPEAYELVLKFFTNIDDTDNSKRENKENAKYIDILNNVMFYVKDKVEFEKQKYINATNEKRFFYDNIDDTLATLLNSGYALIESAKPILSDPTIIPTFVSVLSKLNQAKLLNKDTISDVILSGVKKMEKPKKTTTRKRTTKKDNVVPMVKENETESNS